MMGFLKSDVRDVCCLLVELCRWWWKVMVTDDMKALCNVNGGYIGGHFLN
jgi:hypothetical protein